MERLIKNGIKLTTNKNYELYQMYTDDATEYYMCIPNSPKKEYKMIIDFPEEYYKSLLKDEIIDEINSICDYLYNKQENYIYILTDITTYDLSLVNNENDKHAYSVLLKQIQKFTYNAYKVITNNNSDNNSENTLNPVIDIVTQTSNDKKFIDWLDINLNGYFSSVELSNKKQLISQNNNENISLNKAENMFEISEIPTKSNIKTKKLVPNNKKGFSNFDFIVLGILISFIVSIGTGIFLLVK